MGRFLYHNKRPCSKDCTWLLAVSSFFFTCALAGSMPVSGPRVRIQLYVGNILENDLFCIKTGKLIQIIFCIKTCIMFSEIIAGCPSRKFNAFNYFKAFYLFRLNSPLALPLNVFSDTSLRYFQILPKTLEQVFLPSPTIISFRPSARSAKHVWQARGRRRTGEASWRIQMHSNRSCPWQSLRR